MFIVKSGVYSTGLEDVCFQIRVTIHLLKMSADVRIPQVIEHLQQVSTEVVPTTAYSTNLISHILTNNDISSVIYIGNTGKAID